MKTRESEQQVRGGRGVEGGVSSKIVAMRRSASSPSFGFTLRHVVVYPPTHDTSVSLGEAASDSSLRDEGSPAELGGLKEADRILAINGIPVGGKCYQEIVDKIQTSSDTLTLLVVPSDPAMLERGVRSESDVAAVELSPPFSNASSSWNGSERSSSVSGSNPQPRITPHSASKLLELDLYHDNFRPRDSNQADRETKDTLDSWRRRSQSSERSFSSQGERIDALLKEMNSPPAEGGPGTWVQRTLVNGPIPLRTAFSQDNIYPRPPMSLGHPHPPQFFPPHTHTPSPYQPKRGPILRQSSAGTLSVRVPHSAGVCSYNPVSAETSYLRHPRSGEMRIPPPIIVPTSSRRGGNLPSPLPNIEENLPSPTMRSPVQTGMVSDKIRVLSTRNSVPGPLKSPNRGEAERLGRIQRVSHLTHNFNQGHVDEVGATKLYQAQAYKRELSKIVSVENGRVLRKVEKFDSAPVSPRVSLVEMGGARGGNSYPSSPVSSQMLPPPSAEDIRQRFFTESHQFLVQHASPNDRNKTENHGSDSKKSVHSSIPFSPTPSVSFACLPQQQVFQFDAVSQRSPRTEKRKTWRRKTGDFLPRHPSATTGLYIREKMGRLSLSRKTKGYKLGVPDPNLFQFRGECPPSVVGKHRTPIISPDPYLQPPPYEFPALPTQELQTDCTGVTAGPPYTSLLRRKDPASGTHRSSVEVRPGRLSTTSDSVITERDGKLSRRNSYVMATGQSSKTAKAISGSDSSGVSSHSGRINRFINFFSASDQSLQGSAEPGGLLEIPAEARNGALRHKRKAMGQKEGKGKGEKGWEDAWLLLHQHKLYLSPDRPSLDPSGSNFMLPASTPCIDVQSCIVDIAYDSSLQQTGGRFVFRLTTQEHTDHLLQAESADAMLSWIEDLQKQSGLDRDSSSAADTSSMALIIKRYQQAKSVQAPSPPSQKTVGGKRSVKGGGSGGPSQSGEEASGEGPSSSQPPTPTKEDTHPPRPETTPSRVRKWRSKVKKMNSYPHNYQKPGPSNAFGQVVQDCPTSGEDDYVPLLVQLCVKVVEAHGIESVGVYRIPGNTAAVNALMADLDRGFEHVNFSDPRWKDVNVVSSLLKAFFRKLGEPILTDKLYPHFIDANRIPTHSQRLYKIKSLIHKLPKHNFETLKYLMEHLKRIVNKCHINKMEARNLALMFGPSMVRPSGDNMTAMVAHMSDQCKLTETFILYCDWCFGEGAEMPPDPPAGQKSEDQMTCSFSDMNDLLRRVNIADEDLAGTKDSLVRSILNVRRNSRKSSKTERIVGAPIQNSHRGKSVGGPIKRKTMSDRPLISDRKTSKGVENLVNGSYQERNIDQEIEARVSGSGTSAAANGTTVAANGAGGSELSMAVEDMRRRREENIYTARRIFIGGPSQSVSTDSDGKVQALGQHTRHLNMSSASDLDVLSPETRERIRRLQAKEQTQNAAIRLRQNQHAEIANALQRAKLDLDEEEVGTKKSFDALSSTSDYSTTSSVPGTEAPNWKQLSASCNGALPSSDYSSGGSPLLTPHQQPTTPSASPPRQPPTPPKRTTPRPWYETTEEEHPRPPPRRQSDNASNQSPPVVLLATEENVVLDKNRNVAASGIEKVGEKTDTGHREELEEKERAPVSTRISQKMRFKSRSGKEKRKDPRRHTLSDLEHVKTAIFGNKQNSKQESSSPSTPDTASLQLKYGSAGGLGKGAVKTKTDKLKSWFKDSFRKSSPDLAETDPTPTPPTFLNTTEF